MKDILTLDIETYYSKEYSLSKMTTEEYIRGDSFQVIGVAVKQGEKPAEWFSGTHGQIYTWLRQFDWENSAMLAHNCAFDGAILSWFFGIRPKFYLDTLSMARPMHKVTVGGSLSALVSYYKLGEKGTEVVNAMGMQRADFTPMHLAAYGAYCRNDADLTYALFHKLKAGFPVSELMVIDQTMRMYCDPVVELDTSRLQQHLIAVRLAKREYLDSVPNRSNESVRDMLMSNAKFASYLESLGAEVPTKVSPRTGKTTYAFAKTDKGLLDLLEHPDERVSTLVAARLGVKSTIEETRTESLLRVATRGRLPIMLNYYGAHTGRFSGGDKLNLQNLPKRGNTAIREALVAPEGHSFLVCDLAQIEARLLAWVAGQDDLVQAFREGRDVYSEFATGVYGRKVTKADKLERFVGKTATLGLGYGMGYEKFQRTLALGMGGIKVDIETNEAKKIVGLYRGTNHKIVSFWDRCNYALQHMTTGVSGQLHDVLSYSPEGIRLPNGFLITYPLLQAHQTGYRYISDVRAYRNAVRRRITGEDADLLPWTNLYGGKVTENIVQALAALLIREQMAAVAQHYKVAFQVHDEIICVVLDAVVPAAAQRVIHLMSQPPAWASDLPVACELKVGKNYGELDEYEA